jgi:hypothetical protein
MAFAVWRLRYVNRLLPVGEYRTALQHRAGRPVIRLTPKRQGADFNDLVRERTA